MYIEFLFVVLPFLALLFGITQLAFLHLAGLATQRAAATGARAAIVTVDDGQQAAVRSAASFPLLALRRADNADSVAGVLSGWQRSALLQMGGAPDMPGLDVEIFGGSSRRGRPIRVRVTYSFSCEVPVARLFMCNAEC